jgi:two-component system, NarL family, invasion response regulator UvrY
MVAPKPGSASTRILMAVPTRIYSEAIERVLASVPGLEIIGSVVVADEIPDWVQRLAPDVLIMDLTAHLIPRLEIAATLLMTRCGVSVVGLLPVLRARHAELFLRSGISGLVDRNASTSELVHAIVEVAAGRCYLSRGYAGALRTLYAGQGAQSVVNARESLSVREAEVLRLVTRGFSSREMGDRLFISSRTVENHLAELYRKLRLNDSRQLSCEAYRDEEAELPFGEK